MTHPRPSRLLRLLAAGVLAALVLLLGRPAAAGHDDFDFGRRLADAREFGYARMVFDGILADPQASEEKKDEARYGLALLTKEQAITTAGRSDVSLEEVEKLFSQAADGIEAFVRKNPKSTHATEARLDVGTIRLAFVQWAKELLDDPGEIDDRGYSVSNLREAAAANVKTALEYFQGLRPPETETKPKDYQQLAEYYWVISQYYAALVEEPCSSSAVQALQRASQSLDDYIMLHEGQLLSIYAMDILGLVYWERAKCATDEDSKIDLYGRAFEWFEACIATPQNTDDELRVITNGYYHLAQVGLDAGHRGKRNFTREALNYLDTMLDDHPVAWHTDSGIRAMIEQSRIECQRGNATRAVEIAQQAADYAKQDSKPYLERAANRQLNEYVSGACGGSIGGLPPEVLMRVADDLDSQGKYPEAIRAYRSVITSTPDTSSGFVAFAWKAWEKMADCYAKLEDNLGAALALGSIHDAWKNGLIPRGAEDEGNHNQNRAANDRRRAMSLLKALSDETGNRAVAQMYAEIQRTFPGDYPDTDITEDIQYINALQTFNQAVDDKQAKKSGWRDKLADARTNLRAVAKQVDSGKYAASWLLLVRIEYVLDDNAATVKTADDALTALDSPEAKAQEQKYDSVATRREDARSQILYWKARALSDLGKTDEVVATLSGYAEHYPRAKRPYPRSYAASLLISAVLDQGKLDAADQLYRRLLREDPGFTQLANITQKFANHYDEQRRVIETKLNDVKRGLNEITPKVRDVEREYHRLTLGIIDTDKLLQQYKTALELFEANEKLRAQGGRPQKIVSPTVLAAARKEAKDKQLAKRKEEMTARLKTIGPERETLTAKLAELSTKRHELEQAIYEPLTKAAAYWKAWDSVLKTLQEEGNEDAHRDPRNLRAFGKMYHTAARLRPEVRENWEAARQFFEDYLADKSIQRLGNDDPDKREAISALGDTYENLAQIETDPARRRELVTRAVDLLQSSIATNPRDNDLVLNMLANKVMVLGWPDRTVVPPKLWRFAFPVVSTAQELRAAARDLTKKDNPYRPAFDSETEEREWDAALNKFLRQLQSKDDGVIQGWLPKEGASSFDPALYAEMADSHAEFRLALAWAYSKTGRDEDVPKAHNLAMTFFLRSRLAAEEGGEDYWRANAILLDLYLDTAERWSKDSTTSADAAALLDRAAELVQRLYAYYPRFGEETIAGNGNAWRKRVEHLNKLRGDARMSRVLLTPTTVRGPGAANDSSSGR